jgi:hypothetical protein
MAYTQKDLSPLVRGDDWSFKLTITSNGSPVNITGYTYWFTLKDNIDESDPGDVQVTANPSATGTPAQGIVYINVNKSLTNSLVAKTYNYDIQQLDAAGKIQTLLLGKVKVVKDVTRSNQ